MSTKDVCVLALHLTQPEQFMSIYGGSVTSVAHQDLIDGFRKIVPVILGRYPVLTDIHSPYFGVCYVLFSFQQVDKPEDLPVDIEEQISVLIPAGKYYARNMLQEIFGTATGSKIDFKLIISPVPDLVHADDKIAAYVQSSLYTFTSAGKPFVPVNRRGFKAIIDEQKFSIHLQPFVTLQTSEIVGYEALARGPRDTPLYEATNLFGTGFHFGYSEKLEMACISKVFDNAEVIPAPLWLSINIGPQLLSRPRFFKYLSQEKYRYLHPRLILEITEHLPIAVAEKLQKTVKKIKALGVRFALDDSGCGFTDIDTIKLLRPDIVKLCITVISRIGKHPAVFKDICTTIERIRQLGGKVLAEGVEEQQQVDVLRTCEITYAQGFYYGRPQPLDAVFVKLPS